MNWVKAPPVFLLKILPEQGGLFLFREFAPVKLIPSERSLLPDNLERFGNFLPDKRAAQNRMTLKDLLPCAFERGSVEVSINGEFEMHHISAASGAQQDVKQNSFLQR